MFRNIFTTLALCTILSAAVPPTKEYAVTFSSTSVRNFVTIVDRTNLTEQWSLPLPLSISTPTSPSASENRICIDPTSSPSQVIAYVGNGYDIYVIDLTAKVLLNTYTMSLSTSAGIISCMDITPDGTRILIGTTGYAEGWIFYTTTKLFWQIPNMFYSGPIIKNMTQSLVIDNNSGYILEGGFFGTIFAGGTYLPIMASEVNMNIGQVVTSSRVFPTTVVNPQDEILNSEFLSLAGVAFIPWNTFPLGVTPTSYYGFTVVSPGFTAVPIQNAAIVATLPFLPPLSIWNRAAIDPTFSVYTILSENNSSYTSGIYPSNSLPGMGYTVGTDNTALGQGEDLEWVNGVLYYSLRAGTNTYLKKVNPNGTPGTILTNPTSGGLMYDLTAWQGGGIVAIPNVGSENRLNDYDPTTATYRVGVPSTTIQHHHQLKTYVSY